MIKDKLINADTYYRLSNSIKAGLEWLRSADLVNIKDGQYFIDGNRIFVNVQSYETKKEASFEAHRKYVDIQYMIKGAEKIGIADYSSCTPITEYDKDKDIEFLDGRVLGDIYICVDKAKEQAKEYGHSLLREYAFLCIHGFYHLLGYDHMTEKEEKIMFAKQEEVLNEYGITREKEI